MPAHRHTNREIEVKLRVPDVEIILCELRNLGATCKSRVLERNTLYDTPDSAFRKRGALLRIRIETPAPRSGEPAAGQAGRTILTSKAPARPRSPNDRRYKEKLERELVVSNSPSRWHQIFRALGLRPAFRYEKYRTTFRLRSLPNLAFDLDETPAGTFLELEGAPKFIDRAARALGFAPRDYYRGTYWDVYAADCRRRGRTPRNMVFG
ncbi:MAG: class IV adenylate cyclase [Candidatus Acidiferrales bacterium]